MDSSMTNCYNNSLFLIQNTIKQYVDAAIKTASLLNHEPAIANLCLSLHLIVEQLQ